MNIGDGHGSGQDHCELVGGSESSAAVAGDYGNSPKVKGTIKYAIHGKFSSK